MIIADTKFEFGLAPDGTLVLMDEVLTPDSSRYWPVEGYEAAWPLARTPPATTSSSCATGWSRPR
jgi:phosphoribosylaminoimidazole-succinocarboxamide synthase